MNKEAVGAVGLALLTAVGLFVATHWEAWTDLRRCDAAIQAQLKAPSTYKRISPTWWDANYVSKIEYDAENSFGVPLRAHGICITGKSSASWIEVTS